MPSPDILINAGMILNCLFVFSIMVFLFAKELRKELKPVMDATTKIEEQELEFNISSSRIIEFNDILKSIYNMKNSLKKVFENAMEYRVSAERTNFGISARFEDTVDDHRW